MLHKKGDPLNPSNYRPIALINTITKLFTRILNSRLNRWSSLNNLITEFQAGFRHGRGCIDNIFVLNALLQFNLMKEKGKVFALFVDFRRAFPSIN